MKCTQAACDTVLSPYWPIFLCTSGKDTPNLPYLEFWHLLNILQGQSHCRWLPEVSGHLPDIWHQSNRAYHMAVEQNICSGPSAGYSTGRSHQFTTCCYLCCLNMVDGTLFGILYTRLLDLRPSLLLLVEWNDREPSPAKKPLTHDPKGQGKAEAMISVIKDDSFWYYLRRCTEAGHHCRLATILF